MIFTGTCTCTSTIIIMRLSIIIAEISTGTNDSAVVHMTIPLCVQWYVSPLSSCLAQLKELWVENVVPSDKKMMEECAPGKPITVFSSTPPRVSYGCLLAVAATHTHTHTRTHCSSDESSTSVLVLAFSALSTFYEVFDVLSRT